MLDDAHDKDAHDEYLKGRRDKGSGKERGKWWRKFGEGKLEIFRDARAALS